MKDPSASSLKDKTCSIISRSQSNLYAEFEGLANDDGRNQERATHRSYGMSIERTRYWLAVVALTCACSDDLSEFRMCTTLDRKVYIIFW